MKCCRVYAACALLAITLVVGCARAEVAAEKANDEASSASDSSSWTPFNDPMDAYAANMQKSLTPAVQFMTDVSRWMSAANQPFPSLSLPNRLEPVTNGLLPGFYLFQKGKLMFSDGAQQVLDAPNLQFSILPDGRVTGNLVDNPSAQNRELFSMYLGTRAEGSWVNKVTGDGQSKQVELRWTQPFRNLMFTCSITSQESTADGYKVKGVMQAREPSTGQVQNGAFVYFVTRVVFAESDMRAFYSKMGVVLDVNQLSANANNPANSPGTVVESMQAKMVSDAQTQAQLAANLVGVFVEGDYLLDGETLNTNSQKGQSAPTIMLTLDKGGVLTGTAKYSATADGKGQSVRQVKGVWTPTFIRYAEQFGDKVYVFRGAMEPRKNSLVGYYSIGDTFSTNLAQRVGIFSYKVTPLKLKGTIEGGSLKAGQYVFQGVTTNADTPNLPRQSADLKLTLFQDGRLEGVAEYPATQTTAAAVRDIKGSWTYHTIFYQELWGQQVYTFQGVMTSAGRLSGAYSLESVPAPDKSNAALDPLKVAEQNALPYAWRGYFTLDVKSVSDLSSVLSPTGVLVEGEYMASGFTSSLPSGVKKDAPVMKLNLARGGAVTGFSQTLLRNEILSGVWTSNTLLLRQTVNNVLYTYFGAMKDGRAKVTGYYFFADPSNPNVKTYGLFEYTLRPVQLRDTARSGNLQPGLYSISGTSTNINGKTKGVPQMTMTLKQDGSLSGLVEYPAAGTNGPNIRELVGNWSQSAIRYSEKWGFRDYYFHGMMVDTNRLMGSYAFDPSIEPASGKQLVSSATGQVLPKPGVPLSSFWQGTFDYRLNYLGLAQTRHPEEPVGVLVEGEYLCKGTTTGPKGNTKDSALFKFDLIKGGQLSGFAQYGILSRVVKGTWTPTTVRFVEKINGVEYTYLGSMDIQNNRLSGVYTSVTADGVKKTGRFVIKVTPLRLRQRAATGSLYAGQYRLSGTTTNAQTKQSKPAAVTTITLAQDGKLSGFAEYPPVAPAKEPTLRKISGSWTPTGLTYQEKFADFTYTFTGAMVEQNKLSGSYAYETSKTAREIKGTFEFKVDSMGVHQSLPPAVQVPQASVAAQTQNVLNQLNNINQVNAASNVNTQAALNALSNPLNPLNSVDKNVNPINPLTNPLSNPLANPLANPLTNPLGAVNTVAGLQSLGAGLNGLNGAVNGLNGVNMGALNLNGLNGLNGLMNNNLNLNQFNNAAFNPMLMQQQLLLQQQMQHQQQVMQTLNALNAQQANNQVASIAALAANNNNPLLASALSSALVSGNQGALANTLAAAQAAAALGGKPMTANVVPTLPANALAVANTARAQENSNIQNLVRAELARTVNPQLPPMA